MVQVGSASASEVDDEDDLDEDLDRESDRPHRAVVLAAGAPPATGAPTSAPPTAGN